MVSLFFKKLFKRKSERVGFWGGYSISTPELLKDEKAQNSIKRLTKFARSIEQQNFIDNDSLVVTRSGGTKIKIDQQFWDKALPQLEQIEELRKKELI